MPNRIFLLGPDQWDGEATPALTPRISALIAGPPAALTPHRLRLALRAAIAKESGGSRAGIVMERQDQAPGEDDAEFFRRLELAEAVDSYFVILPARAKVIGTVFEGGMLRRDFHHGLHPRIVLFLEKGVAFEKAGGRWEFQVKGKRTRYLESLAARATHVAIWVDLDDLLEQVLQRARFDG